MSSALSSSMRSLRLGTGSSSASTSTPRASRPFSSGSGPSRASAPVEQRTRSGSENRRDERGAGGGRRRPNAGGRPARLPPYEEWLNGVGRELKYPKDGPGPHWIGKTPFPLNPSFIPPAPLSQGLRDELWARHSSDPHKHTVRALSAAYSVAPAKVEAVLRLKALEVEWTAQGKPLQTEFSKHMDRLLGSAPHAPRPRNASASTSASTMRTAALVRSSMTHRGPLREELPESGSAAETASVLGPAMAASLTEHARRVTALPTGGPQAGAAELVRQAEAGHAPTTPSSVEMQDGALVQRLASARPHRATLVIADLGAAEAQLDGGEGARPKSYVGAGRLARNERRREKRSRERRGVRVAPRV